MTVTGRVRTDQEIVQEALRRLHARDGWVHSSENQLRADAVAALGRLQEQLAAAEAERDTAIQERDEALRVANLDDAAVEALVADHMRYRETRARLERVEAAAREAHHIAMNSRASLRREQFASPAFKQIRDVLAAALSDVTPPSE
jgi:hypothetical protein